MESITQRPPYKERYNIERQKRRVAERELIGFIPDLKEVVGGVIYTERWKDIDGYDGIYQVSDFGRIKSFFSGVNKLHGKLLKPNIGDRGYSYIMLYKGDKKANLLLHRLVAIAFMPNPENKPEINHIGKNSFGLIDKSYNEFYNLEWSTRKENEEHATKNGLKRYAKGEASGAAKLKESDVLFIRSSKLPKKELAVLFNISRNYINAIMNGRSWKHLL